MIFPKDVYTNLCSSLGNAYLENNKMEIRKRRNRSIHSRHVRVDCISMQDHIHQKMVGSSRSTDRRDSHTRTYVLFLRLFVRFSINITLLSFSDVGEKTKKGHA